MGNSAKRDARAADTAEKQRKVLELRKAGATYDQIADQLKLKNRSVAWKLFKAAIATVIREPAQDVLSLELGRLDAMLLGCWAKAKAGDGAMIDRALRIMDRRAAYLGLDAPKALHFDVSKLSDEQLQRLATGDVATLAAAGVAGAPEAGDSGEVPGDGTTDPDDDEESG